MLINCKVEEGLIKYIDELILLLTPREHLTFNKNNQQVNLEILHKSNSVICRVYDEQREISITESNDDLKLLLKRSVFRALSEYIQRPLSPWGILTGVRPTKVIQGFLDDGLEVKEIKKELADNYFVSKDKIEIMFNIRSQQDKVKDLNEKLHLYIGIPFCPSRCSYCSFTSYTTEKSKSMIAPYLCGLMEEIKRQGSHIKEKISTIYIGGGTPSTLTTEQLEKLLGTIRNTFDLNHVKEYTFEGGRPDTLTKEKLQVVKNYGINRLSINPQTMSNKTLKTIGRTHTKEEFIEIFNVAKGLGFNWINTDLIIGLEDEGYIQYRNTLEEIVQLNPENITIHSLALKRAAIQRGRSQLHFDEAKKIMDYTYEVLGSKGYNPYYLYRQKSMAGNQENVGFAKPGFISPYNIVSIEETASIIALGSGGISKIIKKDGTIERYSNPKDPNQYLEKLKGL